jgi:hypothetical protein
MMPQPLRPAAFVLALGLTLGLGLPLPAAAQPDDKADDISGTYEVRFEEIASNCTETGMQLRKGEFTLAQDRGRKLEVSFPMTPVMYGKVNKDGKFRAEAKKGGTAIAGVDGRFSVAGRVNDRVIQLVFIAEYYRGKSPLCTQSWNASGIRAPSGS